ncbi:MAG UNVERIFIED_CONTAM: DUF1549 domain-containing protein [Planctomycetaceae bacterium]
MDENGVVQVAGSGEGAVTAWFSSRIVIAGVTVPFPNTIPPEVYTAAPRRNLIDQHVLPQLQRLNLAPSPRCSDEVFIRRAFLDTIGTLPTADEVRNFLGSTDPAKRDQLIEALLLRPEFVDYWTYRWSDLLLLNGTELRPEAIQAWYKWIHDRVSSNLPWDQFVREIVTSKGSSLDNGATNFFARHQAPEGHGRERQPGVPGTFHRLRSLPQPPARKMDQRSVLRVRQSLRPGSCQGLGR